MSRARVEIINEENKVRDFEELETGTVFEFEGCIYLKTDSGHDAILLTDGECLGRLVYFYDDDSVIVCDNATITVRTRAK